jgi:hypothetical protein
LATLHRMRHLLFLLCSLVFLCGTHAQDTLPVRTFQPHREAPVLKDRSVQDPSSTGSVTITPGPGVERTMERFTEVDHVQNGFRVQIFLGDRKTAEDTKRGFLQHHPDIPAYLSWLAPNFRLRVGDLRTRLEAEHLLREMKLSYPGSYIVSDEIEMPRVR